MNAKSDQELLRDYAERGDEAAFAEFVRRYVNLVHSAALRMTGRSPMSEDITQSVFLAVAQSARSLSRRAVLCGWLHCTTRNVAANAIRSEMRRKAREQEAAAMNEISSSEAQPAWELMAPHLDSALGQMRAADRDVMLLRFFEGRSMSEIAGRLGVSEAAAKKRVARALEKLRSRFAARGVAIPSAIIASALAAHSVEAAPAGLSAAVAGTSSAAAATSATAGSLSSTLKLVAMTKLQAAVLGLLFLGGIATPVLVSFGSNPQGRTHTGAGLREDAFSALQTNNQAVSSLAGALNPQFQTNSPSARLHAFLRKVDQGRSVWGGLAPEEEQELEFLLWSLPTADYPKAFAWRSELRREPLRRLFERTLADYWSELSPVAALAAVQAGRETASWLTGEILQKWAPRNPAAALEWVRRSATGEVHDSALAGVLPELARTDPQGAIAALDEMPPGMPKQRALCELVQQWATQDPSAAANYLTNLPPSTQRSKLMTSVAATWAEKDFDAVLSWAQKLPEPDQANAQDGLLRVMEEKDPAQAAAVLRDLGKGDDISRTIQNWAKADLGSASQWVQALPEGTFRKLALAGLVDEWKNSDPRNAADFVAAIATEKENYSYLFHDVLASWAGKDSQAAADWVKGLPDGAVRGTALEAICTALSLSNPTAAAGFVAGLPPGEEQSKLAARVAVCWAGNDPLAAVQWVAAFPEGPARLRAVGDVGQFLRDAGRDLSGCRRWLSDTSFLSDDEKLKLVGK